MHNLQSKLHKWTREKTYTEREDKIHYTELFPDYRLRPSIGSKVRSKYKVENTVVGAIVLQIITSTYAKCYDTNVSGNMFQAWQSCKML
jgi:hypothetical protein